MGSGAFVSAFGALLGGNLSDRFGRKSLMVGSLLTRAALYVVFAYLVWVRAGFASIAALFLMNRFLGAVFIPSNEALVADLTEPEERIEAYGMMRIGANLGWALGPAVGGILAMQSYASLFLLTAVTSLLSAAILVRGVTEPKKSGPRESVSLRPLLHDRRLLGFNANYLAIFIVMGQLVVTLAVYATGVVGITEAELGVLFSVNGLLVVLFQLSATRLIKRAGELRISVVGAILYGLGYLSIGYAPSFYWLLGSMVIITAGEILVSPASLSLISRLAPENLRGSYLGSLSMVRTAGWSLGPLLGGFLLDLYPGRSPVPWVIFCGIAVAAALGFGFIGATTDRSPPR
jgi:MFS family permease